MHEKSSYDTVSKNALMDIEEFERIIRESLNKLPDEFKDILKKNQIGIIGREKVPEPLKKKYPKSTVFGVFIGVPYGRFFNIQLEPTRIELYKESFEESFNNRNEVESQILRTVVHEIAHYFGFSESEIRKMGY